MNEFVTEKVSLFSPKIHTNQLMLINVTMQLPKKPVRAFNNYRVIPQTSYSKPSSISSLMAPASPS